MQLPISMDVDISRNTDVEGRLCKLFAANIDICVHLSVVLPQGNRAHMQHMIIKSDCVNTSVHLEQGPELSVESCRI